MFTLSTLLMNKIMTYHDWIFVCLSMFKLCCCFFSGILIPMVVDICKGYKSPLTGHWAVFRYGSVFVLRRPQWNGGLAAMPSPEEFSRILMDDCYFAYVVNHLQNAKYLGSMKPFSDSVIGSLGIHIQALAWNKNTVWRLDRFLLGVKHFFHEKHQKKLAFNLT